MDMQKSARKIKESAREVAGKIRKPEQGGVAVKERETTFSVNIPDAREVYVAGDFNGWDVKSIPMKREKNGTWSAKVKLAPGRYEYNFYVDGEWVNNTACDEIVKNPFGTYNCVIRIE